MPLAKTVTCFESIICISGLVGLSRIWKIDQEMDRENTQIRHIGQAFWGECDSLGKPDIDAPSDANGLISLTTSVKSG
jgi:hypothetical protein